MTKCSNPPLSRALALASRQGGVLTRSQLHGVGVSQRTLSRRVAEGLWSARGRDVVVLSGTPDDLLTRSRVAGLRHPGVVLTGASAAAFIGDGPWSGVDLGTRPWIVGRRHQVQAARVITHPGITAKSVGPWRIAGIRDTVVDLLRFLPLSEARTVAFQAVQSRKLTMDQLAEQAGPLLGLAGMRQFDRIVLDLATGAHSHGERELVLLLRRAGITGWQSNVRVRLPGGYAVVDVAFAELRIAIEVDGRAFHTDRRSFQRDRTRQNRLVSAGWEVLRYTWEDVTQRPDQVIAEIAAACSRAGAR